MARGSLVAAASCRAANARLLAQQVLEPARHCRLWTGHDPGVSSVRGPAPIGRTSTVSPMAATIRTAIAQQVPVLLSRTVVLDSPLGSDRGLEREVVAVGVGEPDHCVVTAVEPERLLRYTWRNGPLDTVVTWRSLPKATAPGSCWNTTASTSTTRPSDGRLTA